jgi:hypothetical protein
MDPPHRITNLVSLQNYEQTLRLRSQTISRGSGAAVIEIHLSSLTLTQDLILLIQSLFAHSIIISSLELLNCKLNNLLDPLLKLIDAHLCSSFRVNLTGSCKKQSDIDSLLSLLQSKYLIGVNLTTSSRVTVSPLLTLYSQLELSSSPSHLLSLVLDNIHLRRDDAHCLHHLLVSSHCVLKVLSLRSCGFTSDEKIYEILMSSLSLNSSLLSLDISKNIIRNPQIATSCLHLLNNSTLKTVICEENRLTHQVSLSSLSSDSSSLSLLFFLAIVLLGFDSETLFGSPSVLSRLCDGRRRVGEICRRIHHTAH